MFHVCHLILLYAFFDPQIQRARFHPTSGAQQVHEQCDCEVWWCLILSASNGLRYCGKFFPSLSSPRSFRTSIRLWCPTSSKIPKALGSLLKTCLCEVYIGLLGWARESESCDHRIWCAVYFGGLEKAGRFFDSSWPDILGNVFAFWLMYCNEVLIKPLLFDPTTSFGLKFIQIFLERTQAV